MIRISKKKLTNERKQMITKRKEHIMEYGDKFPGSLFARFLISGQSPLVKEPKNPDGTVNLQKQAYLYRQEYWENFDFSKEDMLRTPVFHNKLEEYIGKYVPQNRDSLIKYADWLTRQTMANDSLFKYTANYIGIKYKKPDFMGGDGVYAHMVEQFFTNELAFWSSKGEIRQLQYDASLRKKSLPGAIAQNFEATDIRGNVFNLHALTSDYIVLYFYSTTCENCQKETPILVDFYNTWKDKGVEVVAFCIDEDVEAWKTYVQKTGMQWINLIDPDFESGYNAKYHVDITPEMYLMDNTFKILGKDLKTHQLQELIERSQSN